MRLDDLNERFPDDCSRRETIRLDYQSQLLKESKGPQTGIYWWVPHKINTTSIIWRLVEFFDDDYGPAYHKEIWEKYAATILGIDDVETTQEVKDAYHGLPRGRVNTVKSKVHAGLARYVVLRGSDAPLEDANNIIISRFRLPPINTVFSFDSHETTNDDEVEIVKQFMKDK